MKKIDLEGNFAKGWNPNYLEGGIGPAIASALFLGADEANEFLESFDYDAFIERLTAAGFTNMINTLKATSQPGNGKTNLILETESAKKEFLEQRIRNEFTYFGHTLHELYLWNGQ